ncbi:MAG: transcription-repair coupling factor [Ignavibacteria bacterium]|nr:transcription-repair coupling factor [Ignavibacteria bacterium]
MSYNDKINFILKSLPQLQSLFELILNKSEVVTTKIPISLKIHFSLRLLESKFTVFIPQKDFISAKKSKAELELLGYSDKSILYCYEQFDLNNQTLEEVLFQLSVENKIIIATYDSLFKPVISKNDFVKNKFEVSLNTKIVRDELINLLNDFDYHRVDFVGNKGEYAIRGAIVDIFSFAFANPIRIEFEDDLIVSMRLFDIDNQRSFTIVDNYSITPRFKEKEQFNFDFIFDYANSPLLFLDEQEIISRGINLEGLKCNYILQKEFLSESPINFHIRQIPTINSNLELLTNEIKKLNESGFKIFIFAEQNSHCDRLKDLLNEYSKYLEDLIDSGRLKIELFPMQEGFILEDSKLAFFTEHQIFNRPFSVSSKYRRSIRGIPRHFFTSIRKGDYVVHEDFGIGRFIGLDKIKIQDYPQEVMKIEYDEGSVVYVNINFLNKVKKYSSKDGITPKLSKLGGNEWKTTKRKVKSKIQDAVKELISLYAERKRAKGFQFSDDTIWQKELESSFYYEDTPDQIKVTDEIKKDMESPNPMDRLVCGDVGFGKTEVAVRAAFKSVQDSKQVAGLVPTTILAEQHYNTFLDRLSKYPIKIAVLSRFVKPAQQKKILNDLENGNIDIIIGTHRILSNDVKFKDLGLLIIDEEHRFGVMAKEKIRKIKTNVDTIYLTATPIPRTLNMALAGSRDISIISTPPPNRLPIITEVLRFDINRIREAINFEIQRKGQIFFVHDRVASINKLTDYLKSKIPEARFCIAHGQMKTSELENVLHNFLSRKFDVLVCTKIIESGLDIPSANTIIINRADRFGLAELYQLRGRVGRTNKQAYAYLLVPSLHTLTADAVQRIQALEEFSEIGSGLNLAMRDLEIRGAGNLLGVEQSGFINSVGFDMYVKLLEEAVEEVKENEFAELFKPKTKKPFDEVETTLDVYFEYNIPDDYIEEQEERLRYYTKIFTISDLAELDDLKFEIKDKFGDLPESVENLFELAKLRYLGIKSAFEKIEIGRNKIIMTFPNKELAEYYQKYFPSVLDLINMNYGKEASVYEHNQSLKLKFERKFENHNSAMEFLKKFLKEITLKFEEIELAKVDNVASFQID